MKARNDSSSLHISEPVPPLASSFSPGSYRSPEASARCAGIPLSFLEEGSALLGQRYGIRFQALGGSMHPTIRNGEMVIVKPIRQQEVRRGTILLVRQGARAFVHRVRRVKTEEGGTISYVLRGDACASFDRPVTVNQVLGRAVSVERNGRAVSLDGWRAWTIYLLSRVVSEVKRAVRPWILPLRRFLQRSEVLDSPVLPRDSKE